MNEIAKKALAKAVTQLNVTELPKGSNSGPQINEYLKAVGLKPGYSWCMAFVYWCFREAAKELATINPLFKTGGVMRQWNETSTTRRHTKPQIGDIMILDYGKGLGHTGIVQQVDGNTIWTIEGNTNDEGAREGFEVARRKRSVTVCKGFIRV
jgi:hypothetical protein